MASATRLTRRALLTAGVVLLPATACEAAWHGDFRTRLDAVERHAGGRFGVAALDTESGVRIVHRGKERFAMCSTFKFLAVAAMLRKDDEANLSPDRFVKYDAADLLSYAPVTRAHVAEGGMTLDGLCAAAIEYSDNTAANLILRELGGPSGVTAFARSLGDPFTRLDRTEPTLNTAIPGDPRDTTTPLATLDDMQKILLGHALPAAGRRKLTGWMLASKTADARLRAGLPKTWRVGSKTGTGGNGTANEIAILFPLGRKPILVASYLTNTKISAAERDSTHAEVGRIIATAFSG
ncbi:MAG: class A beta-lactamase [Pseudomonadota bacterium]|nr:class A beta-lactamase [Pseudomonadota bacterium]